MTGPRRPLQTSPIRLLLLALVLLGFAAAPVLSIAGDVHAALHDDLDDHDHAAESGPHDDAEDAGSLLHATMHASSCCGHSNAIPAHAIGALPEAADVPPQRHEYDRRPASVAEDLFRPPIA